MTGFVDGSGRAMLEVRLRATESDSDLNLNAWIDTGFTGELVLPQAQIDAMGLKTGAAVSAVLADGSCIQVYTYTCLIDWFGEWKQVEVVANQGQFPLLGVGLLLDRTLKIDYGARTVSLD